MAADLKAKLNLDTSGFDDGIKNAKSKTDEFKKTAEETSNMFEDILETVYDNKTSVSSNL